MLIVVDQTFSCCGLIELVADIDAFNIVDEGQVAFICCICSKDSLLEVVNVVVSEVAEVVPGRGSGQVTDKCVSGAAGRIDRTCHDLAQSGETGIAGTRAEQNSTDLLIIVDPAKLHRVVGVDDDNDLVELGADLIKHLFLGDGELKIVLACLEVIVGTVVGVDSIGVAVAVRTNGYFAGDVVGALDNSIHIGRKVSTLTAASADDNDSNI